jgi:citrate lyase beta subunit
MSRFMSTLSSARSLLFTPGSDERKLVGALDTPADAVVVDLEDAVPFAEKERARSLAAEVLAGADTAKLLALRVNGAGTEFWEEDLRVAEQLDLGALVVPKATPSAVADLPADGPPVVAVIETAQGLRHAYETASSPRVAALLLGAVDLGIELRLTPRPDGQEVLYARSRLVVDSAAAGLRAPFDLVHLQPQDGAGLEEECWFARSLGFRGKACIHPAQVEIVNRVFSPSDDEVVRARRVVEAYEGGAEHGRGAIALDGEMVDLAVVDRARQVLAEAERNTRDGN